jgi:ubiquinone/menaquinone biosynthesis C-methylase UbiE
MSVVMAMRRRFIGGVRNSTWAYREELEGAVAGSRDWLDLGCGHQLLPTWMAGANEAAQALVSKCRLVVGTDVVRAALDRHTSIKPRVAANIERLPFATASFDLVSANMVLEHVADPTQLLREVSRVLRDRGSFMFHTPNRRFYQILLTLWVPQRWRQRAASLLERREMDDVFPTHYRVNTAPAIRAAAAAAGFEVELLRFVNSGLTFTHVPPLAIAEIGATRLLETDSLAGGRSNLIVRLRKRQQAAG